jgi:hypothetical protein
LRAKTDSRLKVAMMKKTKEQVEEVPDWVKPANTRKIPYSEEEIDRFVEDFILGLDADEWAEINLKYGEYEARKRIRAGIIKMDANNLINMTPKGFIN